MGLAEQMTKSLHEQLSCHLAWLPLANTFALGDYGVFSRGVFTKMGTVSEFGASIASQDSGTVKLNFASAETTVVNLLGDVAVDVLPTGAVNAKVKISFKAANSFLLKADKVAVSEIQGLRKLMDQLKDAPGWRRSYKVVAKVWHAREAALLAAAEPSTEVTLGGDVPSLQQFNLGNVSASLRVGKNKELSVELLGKSGVIGLGLVERKFLGDVGYLADAPAESSVVSSNSELPHDDV